MGRPDNLLPLLREVSREAQGAFRTHPDAPVGDFDVFEHVGDGELLLLALRSFVGVGRKRGDVHEPGNAVIGSCGRNDASTVRVADEDGWAADPASVRFTVATSPSGVSKPYCAAIASYPSAWSGGITLLKLEPSAQIPWQKTMLGLVCLDVFISDLFGDSRGNWWLDWFSLLSFPTFSLLVCRPLAFLRHPRSDVCGGMQHRNSHSLARIQKAASLDINEV
jgi:hypothetical protein